MENNNRPQFLNKYKMMKADDLVKLAREGNPDASCELARRLYAGKGVDKSYELAREWFEAGVEVGHAESAYELGAMLMSGLGGDEDYPRAFELFKLSADKGNRNAMFELGAMYSSGVVVKKNYVRSP